MAELFIRGLGTQLVAQLQQVERKRPQTAIELQAVQDGVRAMEALVLAAQETQRQYFHIEFSSANMDLPKKKKFKLGLCCNHKISVVCCYIGAKLVAVQLPILVSFLLDENTLATAPEASCSLHESALQDLMRLGPQHPGVFKAFMASAPEMKARLEAAIKGNQELVNAKATPTQLPDKRQVPSIKLKTNFL